MSLLFQNRCKLGGFANLIFSGTRIAFLYSIRFQKGRGTRKILNNFIKPYDVKNKLTFRDVIRSL